MTERQGIDKLRCPISGEPVHFLGSELVSLSERYRYRLTSSGIPLFAEKHLSDDARKQQSHYEKVAAQYVENLQYPHTQEYMAYLDRVLSAEVVSADLDAVAEICCGQGEVLELFRTQSVRGIGVDISVHMLEKARAKHSSRPEFLFVQGDATNLPLASESFSAVFMLGGIHHVSDRRALFQEISRILRAGGRFYWREPVSDFFLWRWIRAIVYRVSPALDAETERPLLYRETVPLLEAAGLRALVWRTYGCLGFCFFMNSDVLVFNRLFRFIPGIRFLTRLAISFDDFVVKLPGLRRAGLLVVGVAEKPKDRSK